MLWLLLLCIVLWFVFRLEQLWTEGEGSDPKVATKLATFYIEQRHDKIQAVKWYKRATEVRLVQLLLIEEHF